MRGNRREPIFLEDGDQELRHESPWVRYDAAIPMLFFAPNEAASVSKRAMAQTAGDVAIQREFLVRMGDLK
jgi:hypothetical protein